MDITSKQPRSIEDAELEAVASLIEIARNAGFEAVGSTAASQLAVKPEVRAMCAADRCHAYGKSWVCPPACGSLDAFTLLIAAKETAVIVQTVAWLEDEFDIEGMQEAEQLHKKRFARFAQAISAFLDEAADKQDALGAASNGCATTNTAACEPQSDKPTPLFLAAGSCTVCPACTYPDEPCRFPEKAFVSLEAAGLVVSEVCESADIPYYHGKGSISYTSCVLI